MTLPASDQEIIRYLLHETSEEELPMIEERLVNDTAFFELIASVEDELIMQYVRGDMEKSLKPRFEKAYLNSAERRARIESARQLRAAVQEVAAARRRPYLRLPLLATRQAQMIAVLLVAALGLASLMLWKSRSSSAEPGGGDARISVVLNPGRLRTGPGLESAGTQFTVPPGTREVIFQLATPDLPSYSAYRVVVGTPERPAVFTGSATLRNGVLTSIVPAGVLTAGDYTLELRGVATDSGSQPIATYYFRSAR
ncbi:MAG: hypothetical protein LAP21_25695 [Acidobacteriia bacterium]|nr:hypothetical protein [Terriglobia bacterium]